ncbi:hypothetical protein WME89_47480 [Sorangium sp. So ce321]|uniref:hypothetical protein n=1 Tax=Sorangium sp. So ce321 TaxID=3133300 RepID=UPI003F60C65B
MTTKTYKFVNILTSLTKEQFDNLKPLTDEEVYRALQAGKVGREAMEEDAQYAGIDPQIRFC